MKNHEKAYNTNYILVNNHRIFHVFIVCYFTYYFSKYKRGFKRFKMMIDLDNEFGKFDYRCNDCNQYFKKPDTFKDKEVCTFCYSNNITSKYYLKFKNQKINTYHILRSRYSEKIFKKRDYNIDIILLFILIAIIIIGFIINSVMDW
ncbi:hypothetical protein ES702_02987 [subsurface metagenome]